MTIQYITSINDTNSDKVLLLIEASLQAYNAFDGNDPTVYQKEKVFPPSNNYDYVDYWSGFGSLFSRDKTEEIYGIVFRTKQSPYEYIFAFRGTDSVLDILDDLGAEHKRFKAYDKGIEVSKEVKVESGFFDVYTENDQTMQSMQAQLFKLIDHYQASDKPINELTITGHSLGSSLCTLFTLDVALSRPTINASAINFACPRTGNQDFIDLYEAQKPQKNSKTKTLRVQNTYDKVPCVPFVHMGYAHSNYALLVAFYKDSWFGKFNYLSCHSALNYQAVLQCAASNSTGKCDADNLSVLGNGKDYAVISQIPDENDVCSL